MVQLTIGVRALAVQYGNIIRILFCLMNKCVDKVFHNATSEVIFSLWIELNSVKMLVFACKLHLYPLYNSSSKSSMVLVSPAASLFLKPQTKLSKIIISVFRAGHKYKLLVFKEADFRHHIRRIFYICPVCIPPKSALAF